MPWATKLMGSSPSSLNFLQERLINFLATGSRFDQVHHEIFALNQIRPDLILLGRRLADHGGPADAGEITVPLTEDLHADQIARAQFTIRRPDVGKLAALT